MKTLKTKNYFVNRNELKDANTTNSNSVIVEVSTGKYGNYARMNGYNLSEKNLLESGFKIENLTEKEVEKIYNLLRKRKKRIEKKYSELKLKDRENQVNIRLENEPLKIIYAPHYVGQLANIPKSLSGAYNGCGKGTAYIKNGKVVAFHYGYDKPNNAPKTESKRIEFSCYQIIF